MEKILKRRRWEIIPENRKARDLEKERREVAQW